MARDMHRDMQLTADYWIDRIEDPDAVLMTPTAIAALNREAMNRDRHIVDLAGHPLQLTAGDIEARIRTVSTRSSLRLHYPDGRPLTDSDWARYEDSLDLDQLPQERELQFGLVLKRTDMRAWPTEDAVYSTPETAHLDRFQENGLFPADAVAVLHESADGQWYFAQSYNYAAWIRKQRVALGERQVVLDYRDMQDFLVVTGSSVRTAADPRQPEISRLQLDMGVRLPLAPQGSAGRRQPTDGAGHAVLLPARSEAGDLRFAVGTIGADQDVRRDYLPFTRRNLVLQAFKFLGEPYGWGHSLNARDCTGLVAEVYRSMGVLMARNSAQQGKSPIGATIDFPPGSGREAKLEAVRRADVGDLLYSTGHVMMYLGSVDGEPYVIHDLAGAGWMDEQGNYHERAFSGVSVTPLVSLHMSRELTYLDELYAIKRIR